LTLARRTAVNLRAGCRPPLAIEQEPVADAAEASLVDAFWLDAALAQLSERERTVIELAFYSDLSEIAIARRLRVPLGSVKSWKRRGLNRLATMLGEESS
jgi:RNA polymerase sigma-70 factor (ECF subfamily)